MWAPKIKKKKGMVSHRMNRKQNQFILYTSSSRPSDYVQTTWVVFCLFFFFWTTYQLLQPTLSFLRKLGSMLTSLVLGHIVEEMLSPERGEQRDAPFCIYLTWIRLFSYLIKDALLTGIHEFQISLLTAEQNLPVFPQMVGLWSSSSAYPEY